MNTRQLAEHLARYLQQAVNNPTNPMTRALLRVLDTETGREILARKIEPMVALVADESGTVNMDELRVVLKAAFGSERIPLFGLISLGAEDVDAFFASCPH